MTGSVEIKTYHSLKDRREYMTASVRTARSVTIVGALVSIILILLKFFAGIFGSSQALIADAVHSVSDLFTDIVVLLGVGIGRKPPDEEHPFGHARVETLASAIVGIALIATAFYIGIKASLNMYHHTGYHSKIRQCALTVDGVIDTHDLRVRTSGGFYQMEIHIVVDGQLTVAEGHRIAKAVESCLVEDIESLDRVIVHVDPAIKEKEPR